MALAMPHIKTLLDDLRKNNWYITAYPFDFNGRNYVVVFEDLREIERGTKYFAVCLTFIDLHNSEHRLETYVNSYGFQRNEDDLLRFFEITVSGTGGKSKLWQLYNELNNATPEFYTCLDSKYKEIVLKVIDHRENYEGFCCYAVKRNGINSHGCQIKRSAKNTAKTRLLRPTLFGLLGDDDTISFCYRKENELDDATIIMCLYNK